jgi:hypothetical protein
MMRRVVTAEPSNEAMAQELAEREGFCSGKADRHYTQRDYATGAEYIAWLKGWRRGQVEFEKRNPNTRTVRARLEAIRAEWKQPAPRGFRQSSTERAPRPPHSIQKETGRAARSKQKGKRYA